MNLPNDLHHVPQPPGPPPDDLVTGVRSAFTCVGRHGELINTVDGLYAIADGLHAVARALVRLGHNDAATNMGALEALGTAVLDGADRIAVAIDPGRRLR